MTKTTPEERLADLQIRIGRLNGKLSNYVDCGGGIDALEKWIDATLFDLNKKTRSLLMNNLI